MTRTTTADAPEGRTARADLVVTLEAPKASSPSPMLEGEATLDTFPQRLRGSSLAEAAPPTQMLPSPSIKAAVAERPPQSSAEGLSSHVSIL
jgi:hypothetical protein